MECLNCGAPVLPDGHCSECGMNYKLLAKAYNTSNYYYNLGLDRARVRDLTGAIDALNLALKYNKQNINARNLLGLIYYEMGEIVLGLTHWVISNSYLPDAEKNIAVYYIKEVQADPIKLEEANQLAKQFNQALTYAKQGTKDLAFIQLRRILSNYPHFVKGYLLLALLYMDNGNNDKAKKAIKRVLRIDKNEDQYKSDLETLVEKGFAQLDDPEIANESYKEVNHNKFNLLYVSVGLILGVLVFWLLILPTKLNSTRQENRDLQLSYSDEIAQKDVTISDLEKQVSDLQDEADKLQKSTQQDTSSKDYQDSFNIIKETMPNTAFDTLCSQAATAISEERYEDAIDMCNTALKIQEGEAAYYYLGKAYLGNHDEEKAKAAFLSIKDNYPDSEHLDEISGYLSE